MSNTSAKFLKAKRGDFFYESVTQDNPRPRVLRFVQLTHGAATAYEDEVIFQIVNTGALLIVSADDRYGKYPPLTQANKDKVSNRIAELTKELAMYSFLQNEIHSV